MHAVNVPRLSLWFQMSYASPNISVLSQAYLCSPKYVLLLSYPKHAFDMPSTPLISQTRLWYAKHAFDIPSMPLLSHIKCLIHASVLTEWRDLASFQEVAEPQGPLPSCVKSGNWHQSVGWGRWGWVWRSRQRIN